MGKLKKLLAVTAALLICTGTMAYMPQGSLINADINTAYAAEGSVAINAANFPDEIFREYVADKFDTNGDGVLSAKEISAVTEIEVSSKGISDLAGIEYLTALETLHCYENQLTSLDVSQNSALERLYCNNNQLTSLDVSKNTALEYLDCNGNQITSLDVSKNTALEFLHCNGNQLTSLDVGKTTALKSLHCISNQLTSLDVSKNTTLEGLHCGNNLLTSLDVSKNIELNWLMCYLNQFTTLDVSNNISLNVLACYNNQLTTLDVSNNTALEVLQCDDNQLTALDVSNNTELTDLYCSFNRLTSIDISNNTEIYSFSCENCIYITNLTDGKFDLSTLPTGFDIAKASEWQNGTVEGNILTFEDDTKAVFYAYDCGNETTATFTLIPTDEPITPPTDEHTLPLGDINGDSTVDASDASNVLAVYALVSTGKESELTAEQIAAADVNKDGSIDASDASLILAYYAHISTGGTGTLEEYLLDVRN